MRSEFKPRGVGVASLAKPQGLRNAETTVENGAAPGPRSVEDGLDAERVLDAFARLFSGDVHEDSTRYVPRLADLAGSAEVSDLELPEDAGSSQKTLLELRKLAKDSHEVVSRVQSMSHEEFQGFMEGLTPQEKRDNGAFLQFVVTYRMTPKDTTVAGLGKLEHAFWQKKAEEAGVTVGVAIHDRIAAKGYGGATPVQWNSFSKAEKEDWNKRYAAVEKQIIALVGQDPALKKVWDDAVAKGGGLAWNPAECEKLSAFAYTSGDATLHAGMKFVEEVEKHGAEVVFANIFHEIGGHEIYGRDNLGATVVNAMMEELPAEEKEKALEGGNSLYSTFGYPETEAYAESYEHRFVTLDNPSDFPFSKLKDGTPVPKKNMRDREGNVYEMLERLKQDFDPVAAQAIVYGLAFRESIDDNILDVSKSLFAKEASRLGFDVSDWLKVAEA